MSNLVAAIAAVSLLAIANAATVRLGGAPGSKIKHRLNTQGAAPR